MSIASSSLLVEMNISVWTANKLDRTTTNKLTNDNGAAHDAAQVRKNLMAGTSLRKEIADFAGSCRRWHNNLTLPWADRGSRLLPTSLFLDYKAEANRLRVQFEHMVHYFVRDYPTLQSQARQHLGFLYDPADYPSVEEVASKFGFRMVFSPLPEAGDFRLDLPSEEMLAMRQAYDEALGERLQDAMQSQWDKLHDMLARMSEKLVEPEGEDKRRWHDTFVSNAHEMCQMLTHLNVAKDPELEAARVKLERAMSGVDIDDIKEDFRVREDVKHKLDAILADYEW